MPAAHRAHREWTPVRLLHWAGTIGVATGTWSLTCSNPSRIPNKATAPASVCSPWRANTARPVSKPLRSRARTRGEDPQVVASILAAGLDRQPATAPLFADTVVPAHANVRGPGPTTDPLQEIMQMLTQQTVTHLRPLRLDGMARAFEEQLTQPVATGLAFEDRFGLLVDRELAWRDTRRLERLLKQAKLKYPEACIEDLDTRSARGLDARQLASLAGANWIRAGHSVLITGATELGKTWLACALGQAACRQGFAVS